MTEENQLVTCSVSDSVYYKSELLPDEQPELVSMWHFVGIDLAPNDGLETGVVALNREREIVRLDKLNTNEQVLHFVASMGPAVNVIVALDVPKSLSIPSRWRQEQVKMHPLRLKPDDEAIYTDRCSSRAWSLYDALKASGCTVFLYFNHLAKERFDLAIPFRARTPRGCKALQAVIKHRLRLKKLPKNLSPSSVQDAMVGAYAAWNAYQGESGKTHRWFWTIEDSLMLEPLCRTGEKRRARFLRGVGARPRKTYRRKRS